MKNLRSCYTPNSIVKLIMHATYEQQYKQLVSGFPDQQIFPPLPTGDEVLNSLRINEGHIVDLEVRAARRSSKSLTQDFLLQCLRNVNLRDIFNCAFHGELRPIFFYLHSPFFQATPILLLLLEDCINCNLSIPQGRKPERDKWKYFFARYWLVTFENYSPDKANMQIEKFFGKSRSTVSKRIRELRNTRDGARILEIIEIAKAYPEMREHYLETYCKEFKELLGHG